MKKFISYKTALLLLSFLLGVLYYSLTRVSVAEVQHPDRTSNTFSFVLSSKIEQNVKLHIAAEKNKMRLVECNGIKVIFPDKKLQWFEGMGEQVNFPLKKGFNACRAQTDNLGRAYTPDIKQKTGFLDYCILFALLGIPLFTLLFLATLKGLHFIKKKMPAATAPADNHNAHKPERTPLLIAVLLTGAVIRVLYFEKFGIMLFQHDWHGHVEFIKAMAQSGTLPLPSKGLEYPQQPLYYLVTGGLYALFTHFGLEEGEALYGVGYFSLLCSMVFLYYAYKFMTLVTQSVWTRTVAAAFVSLTPSLVYLSARINNDSLVMALGAFSLYYIVKSYQTGFKKSFYVALTGVSLLFMTKISAAPMEVLLFVLLIVVYYREQKHEQRELEKRLYWFGVTGLFLLGFTLLRVYLPVEHTFHMVNSSAHYPGQIIPSLGFDYFAAFHFPSLLHTGYSYVYGEDAIRYSFLTYQYGTMLFGEFDHSTFFQNKEWLHIVMQGTLLFGLVYPLGLLVFVAHLHRAPLEHRLLFGIIVLNLLLVLKFIFSYPVVCNTDFRYLVPVFVLFAFVFARGLAYLTPHKWLKRTLTVSLSLLACTQILYFYAILL